MSPISPRSSAARSFASSPVPGAVCAFRHGLLQEAALSTLTPAWRDLYSGWPRLEELHDEALDDHLERLAHYHAQGGNQARAVEYLRRAAARAEDVGAGNGPPISPSARRLGERRG